MSEQENVYAQQIYAESAVSEVCVRAHTRTV